LPDLPLKLWLNIRQKNVSRFPCSVRQLGFEVGKHIQLCIERSGDVEVKSVFAFPMETALALYPLQIRDIDLSLPEYGLVFRAKIVAHHPDEAHVRKEGCGNTEIHGSPAQDVFSLSERSLHGIKCNRPHYQN